MSPGLIGEIEAARQPHQSAAPAVVAPPAAPDRDGRVGSGSLPPTRQIERPCLRGQLCAVARHVGLRHGADVVTSDGRCIVLHLAAGTHVSLGLEVTLGDVAVYAADEARPDWLRLAACAADLHRAGAEVLAHHHALERREERSA